MTNPFSDLAKLFKTEKIVNQLKSLLKGMTMKNWKTSLCGIVMLLLSLGKIWAPDVYQPKINATIAAFGAAGLMVAKDGDVTGGTRQQ